MTKRRYERGDKIRHKDSGYVGTIMSGDDENGYSVCYPCDDEEYHVNKGDIEFVDAKSAFLGRLQALLREFKVEAKWCVSEDDFYARLRIEIEIDEECASAVMGLSNCV